MLANLSTDYFKTNHSGLKGIIENREVISRSQFGGPYIVIKGDLEGNPVIEVHQVNSTGENSDLYTEAQYQAMNQSLDKAFAALC